MVNIQLRVHSLDRALRLLEALQPGQRTVAELCAEVHLPRSTVFRLLRDLETRGYVRRRSPGCFALSLKVLELAGALLDQLEVREASQDVLSDVAARSGRTTHLAVRDGLFAICISRVESPSPLRLSIAVGRRTPLHAGAASKVLLAFSPAEIVDQVTSGPLPKLARNTATTPAQLASRLAKIRAEGYCISLSEALEGVHGVSAPVRDRTGEVVAAFSLGGVPPRTERDERRIVREAIDGAALISSRLGYEKARQKVG